MSRSLAEILTDALGHMERERAELAERLAKITEAIASVRAMVPATAVAPTPLAPPPFPPNREVREGDLPRPAISAAVRNQDAARAEKIVECLKAGPRSTREIAKAVNADRLIVKQALRRMRQAGQLTAVGIGPGRRYALPPARNVRGEDAPKKTPPAPVPAAEHVKARDAAVLAALAKHPGGLTFAELRPQMPDEGLTGEAAQSSLSNALTRLRIKGQITSGEGGKWLHA